MFHYNPIDVSDGLDIHKTNDSQKYRICHYHYIFDISFSFQVWVCNGLHDLIYKAMCFKEATFASVNESSHRIHIKDISKNKAASSMKKADLNKKQKTYKWVLMQKRKSISKIVPRIIEMSQLA